MYLAKIIYTKSLALLTVGILLKVFFLVSFFLLLWMTIWEMVTLWVTSVHDRAQELKIIIFLRLE